MEQRAKVEWDIFCENIRWLAKQHNLTNREMALALKISEQMLLRILNHETPKRLGMNIILITAEYFRYKPRELFRPLW